MKVYILEMQCGIQIKTLIFSLLFGCVLAFASAIYSVRLDTIDTEAYGFGFPLYWLEKGRHIWTAELFEPWVYKIIWQGLIGNIIFWSILSFIATMLLYKIFKHHKKVRQYQKYPT